MNIDELRTAWNDYDRQLQSAHLINEKIITSMIRDRSRSRLSRFRIEYRLLFVLMLVWIIVFSAVLAGNPFDFRYAIQYIPSVLLLTWSVISLARLIIGYSIIKTDVDQPNLGNTLKKLIKIYERQNKSSAWVIGIMMAGGLLFSFSFLPVKIEKHGVGVALGESFLYMTIAAVIYFIAFKSGAFKDRYGDKFKEDLKELEELKSMSEELVN